MKLERKRNITFIVILSLIIGASAVTAVCVGAISVPLDELFRSICRKIGIIKDSGDNFYEIMIWQLRMPRIVMSILAGAALAVCGGAFQSIFRNPVCDPYILGISSGASIGAAVAFILGWDSHIFGITLPALVSALLTLFLILGIAEIKGNRSSNTLLLVGIALNFFISALITLLMVVHQKEMHKIYFWTMGSLTHVSWQEILIFIPILAIGLFILFYHAKALNIMQAGIETAQTSGVDTQKTMYAVLITASVLTSVIVAFCGAIGFIGLIVPHVVRLIFGSNNRTVFTFSVFFGALFLLVADTLARTIAFPSELPVGSITALAGSPYFIYLVLKKK